MDVFRYMGQYISFPLHSITCNKYYYLLHCLTLWSINTFKIWKYRVKYHSSYARYFYIFNRIKSKNKATNSFRCHLLERLDQNGCDNPLFAISNRSKLSWLCKSK